MPSTKVGGKTNNRNNQNCGSSSSDEAEHIGGTCSGGWPSAVSVLVNFLKNFLQIPLIS